MDSKRWIVVATVVFTVGVGVSVAAVTRGDGSVEDRPPPTTVISDEVVDRFLEDFETSLTGTFSVRSNFERFRGENRLLTDEVTVVQRGLDRLTIREQSVSGRLDGRVVTCDGTSEEAHCLVGEEPLDVAAEVAEQVATVRDYVDGPELLYGVSAIDPQDVSRVGGESDRCYTLELIRQLPLPPYGTLARFCFDPDSGAPTLLRVERPEGIDVTAAVAITHTVTDADLTLPSGVPED